MGQLCDLSQTRVKDESIIRQVRIDIIWELVNRIINAKIGGVTKKYRPQALTRVND